MRKVLRLSVMKRAPYLQTCTARVLLESHVCAHSWMPPAHPAAADEWPAEEPPESLERGFSAAGRGWQARWYHQQRGVARYNCADSLDRTNVASFFGAVQARAVPVCPCVPAS